jgi:hypothetical protein
MERHIPISGMFGRDPDGNLRGIVEVSGLPELPHGELKFSCRLESTKDGRMRLVEDNRQIAVTRSRDGHPVFVHPGTGAEIKPAERDTASRDALRRDFEPKTHEANRRHAEELQVREYIERYHPEMRRGAVEISPDGKRAVVSAPSQEPAQNRSRGVTLQEEKTQAARETPQHELPRNTRGIER